MSIDGKIALSSRHPMRISNEEDMERVHNLRNGCDAIVVGIGTVLIDDPKLLVKTKYANKPSQPLRIVLDSNFRIPKTAAVLGPEAQTLVVTTSEEQKQRNVEVIKCGSMGKRVDLRRLMGLLYARGITRLMVEGGETVIWEFLRSGLVDELMVFIAPIVIGGVTTPTLAGGIGVDAIGNVIPLRLEKVKRLGNGVLLHFIYSPVT
jgi:2,5-diamino-6-(ribosylamino)-4(3H)-pyrimidinone 5'-phosphate reductase